MRIGVFLLEMLIVIIIIFCLYNIYFTMNKSTITNDKGELITHNVTEILNDASTVSAVSSEKSVNKTKEEIEKKVNDLMKKYDIN